MPESSKCTPQEIQWWSDKCADCGHMLAIHDHGDCGLCIALNLSRSSETNSKEAIKIAKELRKELGKEAKPEEEPVESETAEPVTEGTVNNPTKPKKDTGQ